MGLTRSALGPSPGFIGRMRAATKPPDSHANQSNRSTVTAGTDRRNFAAQACALIWQTRPLRMEFRIGFRRFCHQARSRPRSTRIPGANSPGSLIPVHRSAGLQPCPALRSNALRLRTSLPTKSCRGSRGQPSARFRITRARCSRAPRGPIVFTVRRRTDHVPRPHLPTCFMDRP